MAIHVQFYNILIPIAVIENCKDIGGFQGILDFHKQQGTSKRILYDEYLFSDRAMSPSDVETIAKFWEKQGLAWTEKRDGKEYWKDLCVVSCIEGPTLPCKWIEYDRNSRCAWMKGTPKGKIIM